MASLIFMCVLIQALMSPGTTAWNWQDWWTWNGWQQWINVYRENGILKDVSEDALPLTFLGVRYGYRNIYPGDVLSQFETLFPPEIEWYCNDQKFYHLILLFLDAPTLNKGQQYAMWRIENIANCDLSTGQTIIPYNPPKPVPATGQHRYALLMCETDTDNPQSIVGAALKATAGTLDFPGNKYLANCNGAWAGNIFKIKSPIVGDLNLTPGLSDLPLSDTTNVLQKTENDIGDASFI